MNKTVANAQFHVALINEFEASCVTFQPQHRVPPGQKYGVFICIKYIQKSNKQTKILTQQPGMLLNLNAVSTFLFNIYVFVQNKNQVSIYSLL